MTKRMILLVVPWDTCGASDESRNSFSSLIRRVRYRSRMSPWALLKALPDLVRCSS